LKRVLFVVLGEKGHVHPFIGPAQELAALGVEVSFYAPSDLSGPLSRAGLPRFVGRRDTTVSSGNRGAAFAALVADPARLRAWIRAMLLESVPGFVEDLGPIVDGVRPDAMVIDPMAYGAAIVAEQRGLPWAGLSTSLNPIAVDVRPTELTRTIDDLDDARRALFGTFGVVARFRVCDCLAPTFTGCFTTAALAGDAAAILADPPVELLGPSLPRGARGDEPFFDWSIVAADRPLVVMLLGSQIWHQPDMFRAVAASAARLGVGLLAATGDLEIDLGPHTRCVPYLPQLDALARASVFVTHGGANSVMEALSLGVPMLVSPICNDQPHNAQLLARRGVAAHLDLRTASAGEIDRALRDLLDAGPIRTACAEVAASYRAQGGSSAAAALVVERLLGAPAGGRAG